MKAERWPKVKEVLYAALECDAGRRPALLDEVCDKDPELRREVETLIASHQRGESFFGKQAMEVVAEWMDKDQEATLVGQSLGHYTVLSLLGEGGMGVVYRALDSNLHRAVALKLLPDAFAADPERLARFQREARVLGSLNHPNIASIYGLEQREGVRFLVLELVEGQTLAERIVAGATDRSHPQDDITPAGMPCGEALELARQIAEGLEAAHEKGIIHRDLKPANIKITPEGKVKILDFGLAKALQEDLPAADGISKSPTITEQMSKPGVILGTAAYMSPEQARGRGVDRRTDIWAFGCVLFEMLSGRRPFQGEDTSDTLAAVMKGEPDWKALPGDTPAAVERLLRRCLIKDPKSRLRDIGDARIEMEAAFQGVPAPVTMTSTNRRFPVWMGAAAGLLLGAVLAFPLFRYLQAPGTASIVRSQIPLDPAKFFGAGRDYLRPSRTALAITPDGQSLVFSATIDKEPQLFLRRLDRWEAAPIAGTEKGIDPFLSPDGQWVGFWVGRQLRKVSIHGGTPVDLCEIAGRAFGASWGAKDRIVLSSYKDLVLVPADGGKFESILAVDSSQGEFTFALPHLLPGGEALLFNTQVSPLRWDNPRLELLDLRSRQRRVLLEEGADARYVDSGHLLFVRQGTLHAVPFDLSRLAISGAPVPLIPDIMQAIGTPHAGLNTFGAQYAVSSSGTLAYVLGGPYPENDNWLLWIDAQGVTQPVLPAGGPYFAPRLSPDGKKVVYGTLARNSDVAVIDVLRGVSMPLTFGEANVFPIWTPDGKRVTFSRTDRSGRSRILWVPADSHGEAETLVDIGKPVFASSWSPDGEQLAYSVLAPVSMVDIWVLRLKDKVSEPFLNSRFYERHPEFSPDGRWLAYDTNESGQYEVFVLSYPDRRHKTQISNGGGSAPCWKRDGRQLFFLDSKFRLMVVDVSPGPLFSTPRVFLDYYGFNPSAEPVRGYDLHPDGNRILVPGSMYGGKPIPGSELPDAIKQISEFSDPKARAYAEFWLRSDPERRLSPGTEAALKAPSTTQVHVVQNWLEELKRLVPVK